MHGVTDVSGRDLVGAFEAPGQDVGARRDGLGLQRLLPERGWQLLGHHTVQVLLDPEDVDQCNPTVSRSGYFERAPKWRRTAGRGRLVAERGAVAGPVDAQRPDQVSEFVAV